MSKKNRERAGMKLKANLGGNGMVKTFEKEPCHSLHLAARDSVWEQPAQDTGFAPTSEQGEKKNSGRAMKKNALGKTWPNGAGSSHDWENSGRRKKSSHKKGASSIEKGQESNLAWSPNNDEGKEQKSGTN